MIEFGGNIYYIDVDALESTIKSIGTKSGKKIIEKETKTFLDEDGKVLSQEVVEVERERPREIDATKYDILRVMIEILMDATEDTDDDSLGAERALDKTSLGYKIAFNTLSNYGILKEKE